MKFYFYFFLLFSHFSIYAQDFSLSGRVLDENADGLPGATVIIKGTTNGTITDIDGFFTIRLPINSVIEISYSGYIKREINIENNDSLNIYLEPDIETLSEVLVIGYGSQEKINVTGSVATSKQED